MTALGQDLRYSWRGLKKSPAFVAVAILTLALGIGANVAVFAVMNAILLNPSGIPNPGSVLALRVKYAIGNLQNIGMSAPDFGDAVTGKHIFTSAAVLQSANYNYAADGTTPERLLGAKASWQLFDVFWAHPVLGRVFRPEEDQPNANHVVVLSYRTWKRRFGGDPSIVGKSLLLNQESYQVVGVMQPEFNWPNQAELWTPIGLPSSRYFDSSYRYNESLFAVGRMQPGVTLEQANAYLKLKSAQEIQAEGRNSFGQSAGWGMFAMPLVEFMAGDLRKPLLILLAAVATVLLIACANIAGLQLARASGRQHEISVQIALGAGSGRLVQQALMESLLLGVAGVALGLLLAHYAIPLLLMLAPEALAANIVVRVGGPVLWFVITAGALCVILCGIAPAWHITHTRWFQSLQEAGRSGSVGTAKQRLRSVLVVGEIAMAMLLLVGAGLLLRSLQRVEQLNTGFDARGVMSGVLALPTSVYKTDKEQIAFYTAVDQELNNIPGVVRGGITTALPFSGDGGSSSFSIKSHPTGPNDPGPHGNIRAVSPGYFPTLAIPLIRGRFFDSTDRANTEPVVVIDEVLAKQYWPGEDAMGQQINFGDKSPWMRIVGIVGRAKSSSLDADNTEGFYYLAITQQPDTMAGVVVKARDGNPEALGAAMQAAIRRVDPSQPLYDLKTMEQRIDSSLISRKFLVVLLTIFAGVALLLAALGLYGVISYTVALRTREMGIRMALGAGRGDVLKLVVAKGMQLAVIGLVIGLATTFVVGRTLSSLLYQVSLFNPLTLLATSALLMFVVFLASYVPARWAAGLDPVVALRDE